MLKKSAPLLKQKYCKIMKQRETGVKAVLFFKYPVFALLSNVIGLEIGFFLTILKLINYSYGYKPIGVPHFGQVHVSWYPMKI